MDGSYSYSTITPQRRTTLCYDPCQPLPASLSGSGGNIISATAADTSETSQGVSTTSRGRSSAEKGFDGSVMFEQPELLQRRAAAAAVAAAAFDGGAVQPDNHQPEHLATTTTATADDVVQRDFTTVCWTPLNDTSINQGPINVPEESVATTVVVDVKTSGVPPTSSSSLVVDTAASCEAGQGAVVEEEEVSFLKGYIASLVQAYEESTRLMLLAQEREEHMKLQTFFASEENAQVLTTSLRDSAANSASSSTPSCSPPASYSSASMSSSSLASTGLVRVALQFHAVVKHVASLQAAMIALSTARVTEEQEALHRAFLVEEYYQGIIHAQRCECAARCQLLTAVVNAPHHSPTTVFSPTSTSSLAVSPSSANPLLVQRIAADMAVQLAESKAKFEIEMQRRHDVELRRIRQEVETQLDVRRKGEVRLREEIVTLKFALAKAYGTKEPPNMSMDDVKELPVFQERVEREVQRRLQGRLTTSDVHQQQQRRNDGGGDLVDSPLVTQPPLAQPYHSSPPIRKSSLSSEVAAALDSGVPHVDFAMCVEGGGAGHSPFNTLGSMPHGASTASCVTPTGHHNPKRRASVALSSGTRSVTPSDGSLVATIAAAETPSSSSSFSNIFKRDDGNLTVTLEALEETLQERFDQLLTLYRCEVEELLVDCIHHGLTR